MPFVKGKLRGLHFFPKADFQVFEQPNRSQQRQSLPANIRTHLDALGWSSANLAADDTGEIHGFGSTT